jgi:hypothetical protein
LFLGCFFVEHPISEDLARDNATVTVRFQAEPDTAAGGDNRTVAGASELDGPSA